VKIVTVRPSRIFRVNSARLGDATEPGRSSNRESDSSLLNHLIHGRREMRSGDRRERRLVRFLRRACSDETLLETIHRFRDSVTLSALANQRDGKGTVAVLTGVEGGEGVSFLSLMLARSLGSSPTPQSGVTRR